MDYITVKEAAEKWNISDRLVQKYCAEGRIEGLKKFGKSWGIPSSADKPKDPRKEKKNIGELNKGQTAEAFSGFMPLLCTSFEPGKCEEAIRTMSEGPVKDIALAEYHYFSGRPEKAIQESERYITCQNAAQRFSACFIYAYANLSVGNIQHARYALAEIKSSLSADEDNGIYNQAVEAFVIFASSVLLHLPLPEKMPPVKDFIHLLPDGIRAFALYVEAHYLYLKEDYGRSAGIVEATLAMGAYRYPISAIYLHLVAVMDYMSLKQTDKAQRHLLSAWEIARPDDLIEGFGEHHGLLGGMLESVIKPRWPEDFKRIIAITYRFSAGWRKIHNPATGHDVADDLTTTEFAAAMLAARGWTNQEIAEHMNISAHTVKRHISTVLQKLDIRQRQELKKYMLK